MQVRKEATKVASEGAGESGGKKKAAPKGKRKRGASAAAAPAAGEEEEEDLDAEMRLAMQMSLEEGRPCSPGAPAPRFRGCSDTLCL